MILKVRDLKPGMSHVSLTVDVLRVSESTRVVKSAVVDHKILELEVKDDNGSILLVLWDEKIIPGLKRSDKLVIENGFVTSFKGVWRINVGRFGQAKRI